MSQVEVLVKKVKLPEMILKHLRLEEEMYKKEDEMRIAKSEQRRVFNLLLKNYGFIKEYREITEKLKIMKKSGEFELEKYINLLKRKTELSTVVKSDPLYQEASKIAREKSAEFRATYNLLRKDFVDNITNILEVAEPE
ncbi:MAG: hypothetical protein QXT92_00010 [Nitrososphaerota archaeon]